MKTKHKLLAAGLLGAALLVARADAGSVNDASRWTSRERIRDALANPLAPATKVDMPTVDKKYAPMKGFGVSLRGINAAPTPSKRELNTLDQNTVELKQHEVSIRETNVRSGLQTNFTAKRAAVSERLPDGIKIVRSTKAQIPDRVIYANTPGGIEELKEQLNRGR
jgi:hypothetical protein